MFYNFSSKSKIIITIIVIRGGFTKKMKIFNGICHGGGSFVPLTLLGPAYLSISKDQGGGHIKGPPPLNILRWGGVRLPILFGNDLL